MSVSDIAQQNKCDPDDTGCKGNISALAAFFISTAILKSELT